MPLSTIVSPILRPDAITIHKGDITSAGVPALLITSHGSQCVRYNEEYKEGYNLANTTWPSSFIRRRAPKLVQFTSHTSGFPNIRYVLMVLPFISPRW